MSGPPQDPAEPERIRLEAVASENARVYMAGRDLIVHPAPAEPTASGAPRVPALWAEARRARMAGGVARDWVARPLENALKRLPRLIDLPMTLTIGDGEPTALPADTTPRAAFELCYRQMSILGEQGAGKSILMLRVMHDLLESDGPVPVPVVLPADRPAPSDLAEWLVGRVLTWFDGTPAEASSLLRLSLVVPCLEGLDAIADTHLAGWAQAIRRYLDNHPETPMILASRQVTADTIGLGSALTGTVRIRLLTGTGLDHALAGLGDAGLWITGLLEENPSVREWCATPLMLSVVATVDLDGDWDSPSMDQVRTFAITSGLPEHFTAMTRSARSRQDVREQYAVLRRYVLGLLRRPPVPSKPRSASAAPPMSVPKLARGLQGLAKAMRYNSQEYFDTVTLLAASDPAEARQRGARFHAPKIRHDLLYMLSITAVVLSTENYSVAPHVLVFFGWTLLMLWYTRVYGGLMEAPALRWVGRWTHVLAVGRRVPLGIAATSYAVTFAYALMTKASFGEASVVAAVMSAALFLVGTGAGLVKFRVRGAAGSPRRGPARILIRGLAASAVLGPAWAAAALWCAGFTGTGGMSAEVWAENALLAGFEMFTVAGGFALLRHVVDRVELAASFHVPWRLSRFLSVAADRGLLVATGHGYRFTHTTIRAAAEVALAEEIAEVPDEDSGPWSAGSDGREQVFRSVLDETLVRRDVRRKLAESAAFDADGLREALNGRRPDLLARAAEREDVYRDLLFEAQEASDSDPALSAALPLGAVWLFLATGPLWHLVFRDGKPLGLLEAVVSVGLALVLLIAPLWALGRGFDDAEEGCSRLALVAILFLVVTLPLLVLTSTEVLAQFFGRPPADEFGGWQTTVAIFAAFFLPMAVGLVFHLIGAGIDRMVVGPHPTWQDVDAAFTAWRAELEQQVLTEARVLLVPPEDGSPG